MKQVQIWSDSPEGFSEINAECQRLNLQTKRRSLSNEFASLPEFYLNEMFVFDFTDVTASKLDVWWRLFEKRPFWCRKAVVIVADKLNPVLETEISRHPFAAVMKNADLPSQFLVAANKLLYMARRRNERVYPNVMVYFDVNGERYLGRCSSFSCDGLFIETEDRLVEGSSVMVESFAHPDIPTSCLPATVLYNSDDGFAAKFLSSHKDAFESVKTVFNVQF